MGEMAAPRENDEEQIRFLLVVDCSAPANEFEPVARVAEAVRQALAPMQGITPETLHVSIREAREEILHAIEAVHDEDVRRG